MYRGSAELHLGEVVQRADGTRRTVDGTRLCVPVWETCRLNELADFVLGFVA